MVSHTGSSDRVAAVVVGSALGLAALTVVMVGVLTPGPAPGAGGGAALPRLPAPGGGSGLVRALGVGSVTWYIGLLSAPLFLLVGRASARVGWPVGAILGVQFGLALALAAGATALQYHLTFGGVPTTPGLGAWLRAGWATGVLPFLAVAAGVQAIDLGSRLRDREVRVARAEAHAAQARLAALAARLQPHFLFNTMQGVSTLIRRDPEAADAMLGHLADLLRELLQRRDRPWVTLQEELDVLDAYLAIARIRYGDRLDLHLEVEPEARHRTIPFFVLQPLVENALEHGVGRRVGPVRVEISARVEGEELVLSVRDDGPGEGAPGGAGTGLNDLRARLAELHGARARLEAGPDPRGGWATRVTLPRRGAAP